MHLYLGYKDYESAYKYWSRAVTNKATVVMPFEAQAWGPFYGMCESVRA